MKDDPKEPPESKAEVFIDPSLTICSFCNEACNYLETMKDLYDALRGYEDRLDGMPMPGTEIEDDEMLASETRIACTLIRLFAEEAKKLKREASDGVTNLEMELKALKDN